MEKISIVVSAYNEQEMLPLFYEETTKVIKKDFRDVDFELIFVDDGSKDNTLKIIKDLSEKDERVKYISFSRNFGKEAAMYAGLKKATGDYIVIMDADLQDPPKLLRKMYDLIKNDGYDCIGTRRVTRKGEPVIRSFFAKMFYKLINQVSQVKMVDGARDYRMMTREMLDSILELKEYNRFSKGLFNYVGYKVKFLEYENIERVAGKTKWSFWKLFKYAVEAIVDFSSAPVLISFVCGIVSAIITLILLILLIVFAVKDKAMTLITVETTMFALNAVLMFIISFFGVYICNTYFETKERPVYIIKDEN